MLRCGGSFTEILLLGKQVQELKGYTVRISELFEGLQASTTTMVKTLTSSVTPKKTTDVSASVRVCVCES